MEVRRNLASLAIAFICVIAGFVARTPYQPPCKNAHTANESAIRLPSHSENDSTENANESDCDSPKWYTAFERPDGLLVIVGVVTFIVIGWQSLETARSASAAEKNIELQGQQWIVLKHFNGMLQSLRSLLVSVEIANETNFPLELEETIFRVGTVEHSDKWGVTIVPRGTYEVYFSVLLGQSDELDYANPSPGAAFAFSLRGAVKFLGVNGRIVQSFGGLVSANQFRGITFTPTGYAEQSAKDHYSQKPPN